MAITEFFQSVLTALVYGVGIVFVLGILASMYFLIRNELRYRYSVIVIEPTATEGHQFFSDRGGIFVDKKTKNKLFFLKKEKTGLNPDGIPFALLNGKKFVYVFKRSAKNFSYVNPKILENIITKKVPVLNDGHPTFDSNNEQIFETVQTKSVNLGFDVGDEDVNWALNTFDGNKKLFAQTVFMQLLPYIALAFVGVIFAIIFIYFFRELSVLKEFGASMQKAAEVLSADRAATTVISGGG